MLVSPAMIRAAKAAEFEFYKGQGLFNADRFTGTSEAAVRVMIEAALGLGETSASDVTAPPHADTGKRSKRQ